MYTVMLLHYLTKCLGYNVLLVAIIIMLKTSTSTSGDNSKITKLSHVAKRSFLLKEHEFLKIKPLSNEMKSFISKHKTTGKSDIDRSKREDIDKEHMYVVQNGDIVPLNELPSVTALDKSASSFTVIPLIIPITEKAGDKVHNVTTTEECSDEEETESVEPFATSTDYNRGQEDHIFLNKVVEDVEELVKYEKEGKSLSNEGSLCSVEGDWDSDAGGMMIHIAPIVNKTYRNLEVKLEHHRKVQNGFLIEEPWNVTGREPFNHSSVIVLTAISTKKKRIATFIGECRVCDGSEEITGNWMLGRGSKDCKDRQECHTFFSDIFRKNRLRKYELPNLANNTESTNASKSQTSKYNGL